MNYHEIHFSSLKPAPWRANHTLRPEMRVLADSIKIHGWLSPLVVLESGVIVDGVSRWSIAQNDKQILKRDKGVVPVTVLNGDEVDGMLAHVRLNRARGEIIPRSFSLLVRDVVRSGKFTLEELQKELHLGNDELSLLIEGTLFKIRKVAEHKYSQAWVPVESNGVAEAPTFERPPNKDS